jgi:very-short-patch-repair endonuclease
MQMTDRERSRWKRWCSKQVQAVQSYGQQPTGDYIAFLRSQGLRALHFDDPQVQEEIG